MISKKPTIFIIDGLNFVRSFLFKGITNKEEQASRELIFWLEDLANTELIGSTFRVIFDGSFRDISQRQCQNVDAIFTESITADELILEQANFLHNNGQRVSVITSDRELTQSLRESKIKTINCSKFFSDFFN
ncbi:MAG: NYN domain-containing protein [Elusimicrobiaceae bacterium]|nr:NYN domain-containing protein [Elusimicrobiaceae bacterium]